MHTIAESYVKLGLHLGKHDNDYVDAYFGPGKLKKETEAEEKKLPQIRESAHRLIEKLSGVTLPNTDATLTLRRKNLLTMLRSLAARVELLEGKKMTFDQESQAIYDAVSPSFPDEHYEDILKQLETLLPGETPLADRFNAFKRQFEIPAAKLDAVLNAAISEGRKRTKARIQLGENENFNLEYVKNKPWGAYNWFKGDGKSVIQVNTDRPLTIDRALDLASHEGYPGHHVYYCTIERKLYKENGWVEWSLYPLFSPISLLAEGTANFGIQVAFPGENRIKFEKEVLFPLAGLDPATADRYYDVLKLTSRLSFAGNEAARRFIDGVISEEESVAQLMKFSLMSEEGARQRLRFIKRYRSYVINYNLGKQMVTKYIEKKGGTQDQPEKRWQEFIKLLSAPLLPGDIK
ncbi:MAG: hypothetical protein GY940_44520 [bacterium]|nr:hypothetical protein [bacterium]